MSSDEVKVLQVQLRMAGKKMVTCKVLGSARDCGGEVKCYHEKEEVNYWGEETYYFLCGRHDHLLGSLEEVTVICG